MNRTTNRGSGSRPDRTQRNKNSFSKFTKEGNRKKEAPTSHDDRNQNDRPKKRYSDDATSTERKRPARSTDDNTRSSRSSEKSSYGDRNKGRSSRQKSWMEKREGAPKRTFSRTESDFRTREKKQAPKENFDLELDWNTLMKDGDKTGTNERSERPRRNDDNTGRRRRVSDSGSERTGSRERTRRTDDGTERRRTSGDSSNERTGSRERTRRTDDGTERKRTSGDSSNERTGSRERTRRTDDGTERKRTFGDSSNERTGSRERTRRTDDGTDRRRTSGDSSNERTGSRERTRRTDDGTDRRRTFGDSSNERTGSRERTRRTDDSTDRRKTYNDSNNETTENSGDSIYDKLHVTKHGKKIGSDESSAGKRVKRDDDAPRFSKKRDFSTNRSNDDTSKKKIYDEEEINEEDENFARSKFKDSGENQFDSKKKTYTNPNEFRLNKYIANSGVCSRREADELIKAGKIEVNGVIVTDMGVKVHKKDIIKVVGKRVTPENKVYILLNKPKGYITTTQDPQMRQTVIDLVADATTERVYPVGRLDRNTSGVLLLTNDGDLASRLIHPRYRKRKIYQVELDKPLAKDDAERIGKGMMLDSERITVDALEYLDAGNQAMLGIEIHTGQNRVIRRIFEALGYEVSKLDRVYFAGLTKKGLARGKWRFLTTQEINTLKMNNFS